MALRGVLTHRKTRRLARLLDISQSFALGVLEALWHVTAEHQLDGGIGRMSDRDIADEMFYDDDPARLVRALVDSQWLDELAGCRLYVHDWHEHADEQVQGRMLRWTRLFADGTPPKVRKLATKARESAVERYRAQFGDAVADRMRGSIHDPGDPDDSISSVVASPGVGVGCVHDVHDVHDAHDAHDAHRAHDAHDARIQSQSQSQSQSQNPEPDERTQEIVQVPKKPAAMGPQIVRSYRNPRSDLPIAAMAEELVRFMSCDGQRRVKPPDEAVVVRCIEAAPGVPMREISEYLASLYKAEQSPRHAAGPKSYAWFPAVLAVRFRDGPVSAFG